MYRPRASTAVWLQSSRITHRWITWNLHFHACRVITHPQQTGGVPSCALTHTDVTSVYMAALNATMYSTKKRACTVWRHSHGSTPAPVARPHASILNARQPTRWTVTPRFMLYSCLSRHVCLCFLNNCPLARDLAVHLQNVQTACHRNGSKKQHVELVVDYMGHGRTKESGRHSAASLSERL